MSVAPSVADFTARTESSCRAAPPRATLEASDAEPCATAAQAYPAERPPRLEIRTRGASPRVARDGGGGRKLGGGSPTVRIVASPKFMAQLDLRLRHATRLSVAPRVRSQTHRPRQKRRPPPAAGRPVAKPLSGMSCSSGRTPPSAAIGRAAAVGDCAATAARDGETGRVESGGRR